MSDLGPDTGGVPHGLLPTLAAAVDRVLPTDDLGPGALEARADRYILLASSRSQLDTDALVSGLVRLEQEAESRFGRSFAGLDADTQDCLLWRAEQAGTGEPVRMDLFMAELIARTREGTFGDPSYGGNHDLTGWRLLRIPGYVGRHDEAESRGSGPPQPGQALTIVDLIVKPPIPERD